MATEKLGYYTQDTGQNVYHFYMGDEPPLEQYMLRGKTWVPLADGWYLGTGAARHGAARHSLGRHRAPGCRQPVRPG
jgi:hypothetical protein